MTRIEELEQELSEAKERERQLQVFRDVLLSERKTLESTNAWLASTIQHQARRLTELNHFHGPDSYCDAECMALAHLSETARKLELENARLREALTHLSAALSEIDYLCGEPNDMHVSGYDVHCSETAVIEVVRRLKTALTVLPAPLDDDEKEAWLDGRARVEPEKEKP